MDLPTPLVLLIDMPMAKTSTNKPANRQDRGFLLLWIAFIAVYPFIINIFLPKPDLNKYRDAVISQGAIHVSGLVFPSPEMVWIFPKVMALAIITLVSILFVKDRFKIDLPLFLVIFYIFVSLLSAIFSGDSIQYALLGGEGRMDGLLYALALSGFFIFSYLLVRVFKERAALLAAYALIASAVVEAIIVVAQRLGHDFVGQLTIGAHYPVISGTVGNPGMVAAFLLPVVVLLASFDFSRYKLNIRVLITIIIVLLSIALSLVNNRSSFYALLMVLFILLIIQYKNFFVYINIIVILIAYFSGPALFPNNVPNHERSLTDTRTLSTRLDIWNIAIDIALHTKGQPLIGGGFDALKTGIIKQRKDKEYIDLFRKERNWPDSVQIDEIRWLSEGEKPSRLDSILVLAHDEKTGHSFSGVYKVKLDKAHDLFLDRTITTGLFSALIWLLLYAVPIFTGIRSRNNLLTAYSLSIAALFLYYLFWFPVPQVEPIHVALLAAAWGLIYGDSYDEKRNVVA